MNKKQDRKFWIPVLISLFAIFISIHSCSQSNLANILSEEANEIAINSLMESRNANKIANKSNEAAEKSLNIARLGIEINKCELARNNLEKVKEMCNNEFNCTKIEFAIKKADLNIINASCTTAEDLIKREISPFFNAPRNKVEHFIRNINQRLNLSAKQKNNLSNSKKFSMNQKDFSLILLTLLVFLFISLFVLMPNKN
jgi:hypothetical protein